MIHVVLNIRFFSSISLLKGITCIIDKPVCIFADGLIAFKNLSLRLCSISFLAIFGFAKKMGAFAHRYKLVKVSALVNTSNRRPDVLSYHVMCLGMVLCVCKACISNEDKDR